MSIRLVELRQGYNLSGNVNVNADKPKNINLPAPERPTEVELENKEQLLTFGRMEGVEFVIPEGYNSFEEYINDLSAKNPQRMGKLPEPEVPEKLDGIWCLWLYDNTYTTLENGSLKHYSKGSFGGFYGQAFQFFRGENDEETYWDNYASFQQSLNIALNEREANIAAGKGDSLEGLTAKVDMHGVEMTLHELHQVYEILSETAKNINEAHKVSLDGRGTVAVYVMAAKSAHKKLLESGLSEEIVNFAASKFEGEMNGALDNYAKSLARSRADSIARAKEMGIYPSNPVSEDHPTSYYATIQYGKQYKHSFTNDMQNKLMELDVSSDEAFEKSFDEVYNWYYGHMQNWKSIFDGYYQPGQRRSEQYWSQFLLDIKGVFF